jgi:hypothetical protein
MEINQLKGVKPKTTNCKLRSGVNYQGALKKTGVKRKLCAMRCFISCEFLEDIVHSTRGGEGSLSSSWGGGGGAKNLHGTVQYSISN